MSKKKKALTKKNGRLKELEDKAEIHALVARFADAATTNDYDTFKSLWAKNGTWTIHKPYFATAEGVEKIDEMFRSLEKGRAFFVQFVHTGVIELDGDKATARWVVHEVSEGPEASYYNNYAMYIDSLKKVKGGWRFVKRDYHYMWVDKGSFGGDVFPLPIRS